MDETTHTVKYQTYPIWWHNTFTTSIKIHKYLNPNQKTSINALKKIHLNNFTFTILIELFNNYSMHRLGHYLLNNSINIVKRSRLLIPVRLFIYPSEIILMNFLESIILKNLVPFSAITAIFFSFNNQRCFVFIH